MKKQILLLVMVLLLAEHLRSQDFWERTSFNYPGPVYSLYINENGTIFAGASSYIYRSVDNGANWERVKTLFEDVISLSGNNTNGYLYAGLGTHQGQYGGVYRSTDNGNSWNLVGLSGIRIDDLVVTSDGVVFAGSSTDYPNGGIYRSPDNGNSWQYCLKTYYTIKCLAVDKDDNIYAGTDDPGSSGKPTLLKSIDKGDSWFTLANWDGYSTFVRGIGINEIGDIFVYFSAKVFRSQDNGFSWEEVLTGIEHWEKVPIIFNSVGQIFVASYSGSLAGINSSNDNGKTWEQKNSGLTSTNTLSLAINKDQFLFTGASNSIFITTDPTPVELFSFNGEIDYEIMKVNLEWWTATENNNYGFEVEKKDLGEWEKIGFVQGHGTTTVPQKYVFTDNLNTHVEIEPDSSITFKYRLKQIDFDGTFNYSNEIKVTVNQKPSIFKLGQNYPNPFNPKTTIQFSIPQSCLVTLKIYDFLGRKVITLLKENKEPGMYSFTFDASNLPNGLYFYKLEAGKYVDVKKMIVLK